ncbi:3-deoxy-manno-octulosonate cytidylyltransferase [mine drainage metagenome]|uniref:3-deoxy-manno-octulosonate cytidylyltransferase n=1 Tax=mine drainage metagenome TaxID=410659 RepID=A0A1J5QXM5_9ZZZZ
MILAILQARVSSTRLHGKVLKPLLGEPMLFREIERIRRASSIDQLLVATSNDASDDPIAVLCRDNGTLCYRGNLEDVLDRYYFTAKEFGPEHVVRLTGDCPLIDPEVIDRVIRFYLNGAFDYASNTVAPTFPDGLDVEVFRFSCLETAWREARLPSQREHVTPFIHQQQDRFRVGCLRNERDLSHMRWTVDEAEDFEFVTQVYEALYWDKPGFEMKDVLRLLERKPELMGINAQFQRNEGYLKSLVEDASTDANET